MEPGALLIQGIFFLVLCGVSGAIMARRGVFRAQSLALPPRMGTGESPWALLWIVLASFMLAYGALALLMRLEQDATTLTVLSGMISVPQFLLIVLLNRLVRQEDHWRLGLSLAGLGRGLRQGAGGFLLVYPWVVLAGLLVTGVRQAMEIEDTPVHELLALMKTAEPWQRALLLFAATVGAPLWEEAAFRGLIQTAIIALLVRWTGQSQAPQGTRLGWAQWGGIILTSILFALIHVEAAFLLPLFVLSLGLGYIYQRTGNLWTAIGLHAVFNLFNTMLFLTVHAVPR